MDGGEKGSEAIMQQRLRPRPSRMSCPQLEANAGGDPVLLCVA